MRLFRKQKTQKRPRPNNNNKVAPTQAQLDAATEMQSSIFSHVAIVSPDRARLLEVRRQHVHAAQQQHYHADLVDATVEEFLTSFRENGSEYLCTAYL
jgi:hypothetical protein